MEAIIKYFKAALAALLAVFGKKLDGETVDNIETMLGNLFGYEPEIKA